MFGRTIRLLSTHQSSFKIYNFPSSVEEALSSHNFQQPTKIQELAWPILQNGRDLVGIAKTGSGKTLGYLLPMISHLLKVNNSNMQVKKNQSPNSLIILPTRELSQQVSKEFLVYSSRIGVKFTNVFGGVPKNGQEFFLQRGNHTIIGTPGRLFDFMSSGQISLKSISYLVIDEADMLLNMGFEEVIRSIISEIPETRQTMMFTATWPKEIAVLASDLLKNPEKVQIGNSELTMNEDIEHEFIYSNEYEKIHQLKKLINEYPEKKILIFMNKKIKVEDLRQQLYEEGIKSETIHSNKDQRHRNFALKSFEAGNTKILIATDVASRGIDIKDIDYVVNYDSPMNLDDFIHRVGRTGRAGKKGKAIMFFNRETNKYVIKGIIKKLKEMKHRIPAGLEDMLID